MDEETKIPFPIRFNPFKHHRNYILGVLETSSPEEIINLVDPICNNYIDIYTGDMLPEAIANGVIGFLKSRGVLSEKDFSFWVANKKGYRPIALEDRSEWIIRKSMDNGRYIHIHPAHYGYLTIRFKGSTLKTAYALKKSYEGSNDAITLENVNNVRARISLAPIKKLERSRGILNCYQKFFDHICPLGHSG